MKHLPVVQVQVLRHRRPEGPVPNKPMNNNKTSNIGGGDATSFMSKEMCIRMVGSPHLSHLDQNRVAASCASYEFRVSTAWEVRQSYRNYRISKHQVVCPANYGDYKMTSTAAKEL